MYVTNFVYPFTFRWTPGLFLLLAAVNDVILILVDRYLVSLFLILSYT